MYVVFFNTSDVFKAEEQLLSANIPCKVVATPVQDKAYCGVCIQTSDENAINVLENLEYKVIH